MKETLCYGNTSIRFDWANPTQRICTQSDHDSQGNLDPGRAGDRSFDIHRAFSMDGLHIA
jgi:hypothetical protein